MSSNLEQWLWHVLSKMVGWGSNSIRIEKWSSPTIGGSTCFDLRNHLRTSVLPQTLQSSPKSQDLISLIEFFMPQNWEFLTQK